MRSDPLPRKITVDYAAQWFEFKRKRMIDCIFISLVGIGLAEMNNLTRILAR